MNSELQIVQVELTSIKPYKNNAKKHPEEQVANVAESIRTLGWRQPIVLDKDGVIIIGHGRFLAAKKLGLTTAPCHYATDLTDEQVKKLRLLDNKLNESDWDFNLLKLDGAGLDFSEYNLDWGGVFDTEEEATVVEDEIPEVDANAPSITQLGDIWQLGEHRLMCGDSTDILNVNILMQGQKVDVLFTDPPYNVAFNGRSGKFDVIKNDNLGTEEFDGFIEEVAKVIKSIAPKNYYVWCNWKFYATLQTKLDFKACIVWAKNVFGLGQGYRHQHEFCLFNGEIDENIKNESDLWNIAKDANYVHPTQKPVALCARALGNHKKATAILDLFGGSGSTLIACEQLGRKCYMMELDPKYCDVIIKRWETLTGQTAVKL